MEDRGMTGRPVSTGSVTRPEGWSRAYLHVQRLQRIADRVGGKDGELLLAAAAEMRHLSARNKEMGRKLGSKMPRAKPEHKGASFPVSEAAEGICDLAADGPVTAYTTTRCPGKVRVTRADRLPAGARRIGRFDIASDYREVERRVMEVAA